MRLKLLSVIFILFAFFVSSNLPAKEKKYDMAIAAIFCDEAPYLREWIEFHKLVGVQHFYLYNNNSTDNYKKVLKPYIGKGEVELVDLPSKNNSVRFFTFKTQMTAYNDAVTKAQKKARWLACIDLDEFLFASQEDNLVQYLDTHYSDCAGVAVNWQCYGTSHVAAIPKDKLLIEMLLLKAPSKSHRNGSCKSIIQPKFVEAFYDPHEAKYKPGYYCVNTNKDPHGVNPGIYNDRIRINHYWTRDEHHLYNVKIPRYKKWQENPDGGIPQLMIDELSIEMDDTILRFVGKLRKNMGLDN